MFTLTRRESSPIPLDVTGILPETVANLTQQFPTLSAVTVSISR